MTREEAGKKKKKRRRTAVIIIIAIAAVLALTVFFALQRRKQADTDSDLDLAKVTRRTVVNSVSASGTLVSAESHEVTASGMLAQKILSVQVEAGDRVAVGDPICTFDTSSFEDQKESLTEQIQKAESDKEKRAAQAAEDAAKSEADRQSALSSAEESLTRAQSALEQARIDLSGAQANLDLYLKAGGSADDAQGAVLSAVVAGRQAEVTAAQATADTLDARVKALQNPADSSNLLDDTYNATMDAMIAALKKSVAAIDEKIASATVTAPAAGLVTEVDARVGQTYTGGTLALVELDNSFLVEARVGEYDIPDVAVGMKVLVKTDATREEELPGRVIYVAPKPEDGSAGGLSDLSGLLSGGSSLDISSMTGGSSSAEYSVKIALDETNDRLRLGMNARASIITEEAADVLTVPYDAVQEDADGNTYVEVPVYGKDSRGKETVSKKKVPVTKGLEGVYYIELVSDTLKEGDEVVVPGSSASDSVDDILSVMGSGAGL